jgi:hypothetical protein
MSPLLALPDEILAQIVLLLPTPDILHSRLVCFKLSSIISSSVEIQYRIALETSGLEDNGTCSSFSPSEKLSKLLRGQKAWRKFKPQFIKPVKVQHLPSGIYDLSGGIYLLGSDRMLDLDYAVLPERDGEDAEWKSIELQEAYLDMGLCIDEHDLVAIITTCAPNPLRTVHPFADIVCVEHRLGLRGCSTLLSISNSSPQANHIRGLNSQGYLRLRASTLDRG